MYITLLGMATEVKPIQFQKALLPIKVTLLGISKDINPIQP